VTKKTSARILFVGDVMGRPGRRVLRSLAPLLRQEYAPDFVIVNGENAAGGAGLTPRTAAQIFHCGVDGITGGNHIWRNKEVAGIIEDARVIRPANYPDRTPGDGSRVLKKEGVRLGVVNLLGRLFMDPIDCPFVAADRELRKLSRRCDIVLVDFHGEATSEKVAMGWHLDGRAQAVLGTHTHVQTADERISKKGTACITDVGMTGSADSVIGVNRKLALDKFLTCMPGQFKIAGTNLFLDAVFLEVSLEEKRATRIERIHRFVDPS
jgi:hypothetical protein